MLGHLVVSGSWATVEFDMSSCMPFCCKFIITRYFLIIFKLGRKALEFTLHSISLHLREPAFCDASCLLNWWPWPILAPPPHFHSPSTWHESSFYHCHLLTGFFFFLYCHCWNLGQDHYCEDCPVLCRMFTSIPCLYQVDNTNIPKPLSPDIQNVSRYG